MDRDQAGAASRRMENGRAEPGLQLIEAAAEREERGVDRRVGGVVAEQSGLDEVAGRGGLGALGEEEDQGGLLPSPPRIAPAQLRGPPRWIEPQAAEP